MELKNVDPSWLGTNDDGSADEQAP